MNLFLMTPRDNRQMHTMLLTVVTELHTERSTLWHLGFICESEIILQSLPSLACSDSLT